jgi:hypothetical protein
LGNDKIVGKQNEVNSKLYKMAEYFSKRKKLSIEETPLTFEKRKFSYGTVLPNFAFIRDAFASTCSSSQVLIWILFKGFFLNNIHPK